MADPRRDLALSTRLRRELGAIKPPTPDPIHARFARPLAAAHRPIALGGVGLGFVSGAVAVCAALILLTGSTQPGVWLDRAAGGVRHLEANLVQSHEPASSPTTTSSPAPNSTPTPRPLPALAPAAGQLPPGSPGADQRGGVVTGERDGHDGGSDQIDTALERSDDRHDRSDQGPGSETPEPKESDDPGHGRSEDRSQGGTPQSPRPSPSPSASGEAPGHN